MTHPRLLYELFEFISAEDDNRFYQRLSEITDPRELNVIHQVYTPLGLACQFDREEFVQALLEKGADVNCRTGDLQQLPVHFAARGDNKGIKCMKLLYKFGADLNAQDGRRNTPLHHACTMENVILFDYLMENGANVNAINSDQETPLIRAILSQNEYFIRRLVSAGSDVNYPSGTPLEHLIRQPPSMMDCIHLLIRNGADIYKRPYIHTAAAYNNMDTLHLLKESGVDIHAIAGILDYTALHNACESPRASPKIVELLLHWGLDVNASSITFDTPLHLACQRSDLKKVLILLNYRADFKARNASLSTPLSSLLMTKFPDTDGRLCDFYKIFKILTALRTPVTLCDLEIYHRVVPKSFRYSQTRQEIFEFLEAVKDYSQQPGKLLDLCRCKIRGCLAPKVSDKIALLPLPVYLKDFLMFKDIL